MNSTDPRALPPATGFAPVTRRFALGGAGAALAFGNARLALAASNPDARLVVLNARGGLDGLSTIVPFADPALAGLRTSLVPAGLLKVDSFFAVSPSMPNFYAMMKAAEGLAVHAVGPALYSRSHFTAQDCLQNGTTGSGTTGWLNRALGLAATPNAGLAMSAEVPLLLRGSTLMAGWSPEPFAQISTALSGRLAPCSAADKVIGPAEALGIATRATFNQILKSQQNSPNTGLIHLATVAGQLLGASNGPRVAVLETSSFDTHQAQNDELPDNLVTLDAALLALKTSLGAAWSKTVVMTMTEFGRTAYVNGTQGTDHGTGFAVLLAGGAVAGGKVIAKWPGLAGNQLYQGRDLMPTVDFRSVAMGVLTAHLGLSVSNQNVIFPGSAGLTPMIGLIRS